MNVQIMILENLAFFRIKRLHKCQCNLYRFFHDISKLSGDDHLSFPFCQLCLYKQNLTACLCPCKSGDNTRLCGS